MDIVALSDTHERHRKLEREYGVPDGDLLIFAGDMTVSGSVNAVKDFAQWINNLPHDKKIIIAGNHDRCFNSPHHKRKKLIREFNVFDDVTYLHNSSTSYNDYTISGTPLTPPVGRNHVMKPGRQRREEAFRKMLDNTDILVSHGPAYKCGDRLPMTGQNVGDPVLGKIKAEMNPELHIFGHLHETPGYHGNGSWNVCVTDEHYRPTRKPTQLNL